MLVSCKGHHGVKSFFLFLLYQCLYIIHKNFFEGYNILDQVMLSSLQECYNILCFGERDIQVYFYTLYWHYHHYNSVHLTDRKVFYLRMLILYNIALKHGWIDKQNKGTKVLFQNTLHIVCMWVIKWNTFVNWCQI